MAGLAGRWQGYRLAGSGTAEKEKKHCCRVQFAMMARLTMYRCSVKAGSLPAAAAAGMQFILVQSASMRRLPAWQSWHTGPVKEASTGKLSWGINPRLFFWMPWPVPWRQPPPKENGCSCTHEKGSIHRLNRPWMPLFYYAYPADPLAFGQCLNAALASATAFISIVFFFFYFAFYIDFVL